jgi:hypothetical protein
MKILGTQLLSNLNYKALFSYKMAAKNNKLCQGRVEQPPFDLQTYGLFLTCGGK